MIDIKHISLKDCVIVTQAEFDRLRKQKQAYLKVRTEIMRQEMELKSQRAWDEIT